MPQNVRRSTDHGHSYDTVSFTPPPARLHHVDNLHPDLAHALTRLATNVVLVDGGLEKHHISPRVFARLSKRGLVEKGRDKRARPTWRPSAYGQRILATEVPRFLAQKSQRGYVTDPRLAMAGEPEAVDAATQERLTSEAADRSHVRMHERALHERLYAAEMAAAAAGVDITRQRLAIAQRVRALENLLEAKTA